MTTSAPARVTHLRSDPALPWRDALLDDTQTAALFAATLGLDGPLPIALYSAALFTLTEGRAYSVAEYRQWCEAAGLTVTGPTPTLIHCGVLEAVDQRADTWSLGGASLA